MKKARIAILCVVVCFLFSGCCLLYDRPESTDGFGIGYSKILKDAFVDTYFWDGTEDTMDIVIPEEYNGAPITALGGYYGSGVPCAFCVALEESYMQELCSDAYEWCLSNVHGDIGSAETMYLNFTVHISKNIKEINKHALDCYYKAVDVADRSKLIVVPLYSFTCDEDNQTFYAKDGKLYYREGDRLVDDVLYFDYRQ